MENYIRVSRAIKRITQQDLADAMGVRVQTINSIENGKNIPNLLLAMRIALYFETPIEKMFFPTDEEKSFNLDE